PWHESRIASATGSTTKESPDTVARQRLAATFIIAEVTLSGKPRLPHSSQKMASTPASQPQACRDPGLEWAIRHLFASRTQQVLAGLRFSAALALARAEGDGFQAGGAG